MALENEQLILASAGLAGAWLLAGAGSIFEPSRAKSTKRR
jgi:hypothetical protein